MAKRVTKADLMDIVGRLCELVERCIEALERHKIQIPWMPAPPQPHIPDDPKFPSHYEIVAYGVGMGRGTTWTTGASNWPDISISTGPAPDKGSGSPQ